jgi:hypothetical protein
MVMLPISRRTLLALRFSMFVNGPCAPVLKSSFPLITAATDETEVHVRTNLQFTHLFYLIQRQLNEHRIYKKRDYVMVLLSR